MTTLATSQSLLDQPGTVAFLVVFGMAVICVFLFRSMSKHLRKVNDAARAEAEAQARAQAGTGGTGTATTGTASAGTAGTGDADGGAPMNVP